MSVDQGEGRLTGCYRNLSGDPYILKHGATGVDMLSQSRSMPLHVDALWEWHSDARTGLDLG